MSKISYCSLEEAWGDEFIKLKSDKHKEELENNKTTYNSQLLPIKESQINNNINKYENLNKQLMNDNSDRLEVLKVINDEVKPNAINILSETIENFESSQNSQNSQNSHNSHNSKNLQNLQNLPNQQSSLESTDLKENFSNFKSDIFELIILIIIGLIIIFVLDSVYKIGKSVGIKMRI